MKFAPTVAHRGRSTRVPITATGLTPDLPREALVKFVVPGFKDGLDVLPFLLGAAAEFAPHARGPDVSCHSAIPSVEM
ncbi:MAG: hypothetical protein JSR78_09445 [Proteobacteria bacterium]|nr:hypothetical protein [Pseudomonadota bacterium]